MSEHESESPPPRVRRERNPDETRRRILDAAEREFAQKGYDGARLRDVASAAGVHHTLLHHYYGDKEGLFRAVLERAITLISSQAYEILRSTTTFRELFEAYLSTIIDYTAHNPHLISILHFSVLDPGSPAYALCEEVAGKILVPLMEATTAMLEQAQREGTVRRDIDARQLVVIGMGAASFVFHERDFFRLFLGHDACEPAIIEAHKRNVIQVLLHGILRPDA